MISALALPFIVTCMVGILIVVIVVGRRADAVARLDDNDRSKPR